MINSKKFKIILFNVGSGDNILIQLPNGEFGIIDFHFSASLNQSAPPAVAYLENLSKTQEVILAFCCISHYDYDHISGFEHLWDLYKKKIIKIKKIWLAGSYSKDNFHQLFLKKFDSDKLKFINESDIFKIDLIIDNQKEHLINLSKAIELWEKDSGRFATYIHNIKDIDNSLCENIKTFSFGPLDHHISEFEKLNFYNFMELFLPTSLKKSDADNNLISSIIYFQIYNFSWVFGGDAPKSVWVDSINHNIESKLGYNISADFVKVSHHGSSTSSHPLIWNSLTVGKNNTFFGISAGQKYGHPHSITIEEIINSSKNKKIFCTNICDKCLNIESEDFNIYDLQKNEFIHIFNSDRSDKYRLTNPIIEESGFLGFIFNFDLNDNSALVTKFMDKSIKKQSTCYFTNHDFQPYTNCKI